MKTLIILFAALFSTLTYATAKIPELALKQMRLRVEQKNCQAEWVESRADYQVFEIGSEGQKLIAIPCANWGLNLNWGLFLVIENARAESVIVKPLYFIRHSSYKGLYADEVASNINWDSSTLTLNVNRSLNGTSQCGEVASYLWDVRAQDFRLKGIVKKDDCRTTEAWQIFAPEWRDL